MIIMYGGMPGGIFVVLEALGDRWCVWPNMQYMYIVHGYAMFYVVNQNTLAC